MAAMGPFKDPMLEIQNAPWCSIETDGKDIFKAVHIEAGAVAKREMMGTYV